MNGNYFIPEAASTIAGEVDLIYYALIGMSAVFSVGILLAISYLTYTYRRQSPDQVGVSVVESKWLEILWSVVPLLIGIGFFVWGSKVYLKTRVAPEGALEIAVVGKQWMWKFQHPEGKREINNLHVPIGRPVVLKMISQDVIHSLYVPAFRIKQDVLPMTYTSLWFEATKAGEYHLFCAEYCGKDHSVMGGKVFVMSQAEYEEWLSEGEGGAGTPTSVLGLASDAPEKVGERLFSYLNCNACHNAPMNRGPRLEGIFGTRTTLVDGRTVNVDDNYLRESILNPSAKVVAGFAPQMPSYAGRVTEEDLFNLIAYLKKMAKVTP